MKQIASCLFEQQGRYVLVVAFGKVLKVLGGICGSFKFVSSRVKLVLRPQGC